MLVAGSFRACHQIGRCGEGTRLEQRGPTPLSLRWWRTRHPRVWPALAEAEMRSWAAAPRTLDEE